MCINKNRIYDEDLAPVKYNYPPPPIPHPPAANAVVCSKAVVLLLLLYCFMYLPLFVGVLCWSLFWYTLLCVLSSLAIILNRKRELVVCVFVFRMSCHCKCPVALPHGVVGWSAVCDFGISLTNLLNYYSLADFCYLLTIFANSFVPISKSRSRSGLSHRYSIFRFDFSKILMIKYGKCF